MACWFDNRSLSRDKSIVKRPSYVDQNDLSENLDFPPPALPVIVQKVWDPEKELRVDAWMKNTLRSFRRWLKNLFIHYFQKKYYHWIESRIRLNTRIFFLELCQFGITPEFYNKYEEAFFKLIHNTVKIETRKKSSRQNVEEQTEMEALPITSVFWYVFGSRPSKNNLKIFFDHPIIIHLW